VDYCCATSFATTCGFRGASPSLQHSTVPEGVKTGRTFNAPEWDKKRFPLGTFLSGGFSVLRSAGTSALSTGLAVVNCSGIGVESINFDAFLLYSFYSPFGVKLSEATVFGMSGRLSGSLSYLPVDYREGARLGVAIANAEASSRTGLRPPAI
jgi:hypothetical protein